MSFTKDPEAVLDYEFDWSAWLGTGETITSHTVAVTDGITLDSDAATSTSVTAWLSGGTAGVAYEVTCHIVTSGGREDDRTIKVAVVER